MFSASDFETFFTWSIKNKKVIPKYNINRRPRRQKLDKTIVLTGAMIPYKFGSSDGLFNVGSALAFSQALPFGVYIAMNGQYFTWDSVKKNRSTGIFERIA